MAHARISPLAPASRAARGRCGETAVKPSIVIVWIRDVREDTSSLEGVDDGVGTPDVHVNTRRDRNACPRGRGANRGVLEMPDGEK